VPKLQPEDPKTLPSLLEKYGTLDLGINPDEIGELLDQADEEIREADWDLKGQFPNGVLKSAEMAILKMALALALGYCRRRGRGSAARIADPSLRRRMRGPTRQRPAHRLRSCAPV
jgi:hypothetical protein